MCTVTYIPTTSGFVFTSSRDENHDRLTLWPAFHVVNDSDIFFAKDEKSGGSWMATDFKSRLVCLLNGGIHNHIKKERYTESRGNILLNCFKHNTAESYISSEKMVSFEPFTLLEVIYTTRLVFTEFIWDGKNVHKRPVDTETCHIWSSSTLYSNNTREKRARIFEDWLFKYREEDDFNIDNFHLFKHNLPPEDNILMNRGPQLQTVSISKFQLIHSEVKYNYFDVITGISSESSFIKRCVEKELP